MLLVILPPIVYATALSIDLTNFFKYIGTILTFAIFGTLACTISLGIGLYFLF